MQYRKPKQSSLKQGAVVLRGRAGRIYLIEVTRACTDRPPACLTLRLTVKAHLCWKDKQRTCSGCMQGVEDGSELGTTTTQGHPLKRVWDAAVSLHGMGLLHFQVSKSDAMVLRSVGSEMGISGHTERRQNGKGWVLGFFLPGLYLT